jgi:tetratricopeptide (TPR) repeat protein
MKRNIQNITIFLFFSVLSLNAFPQQTATEKFDQGVKYFTDGKFREAIDVWNDLYNTGYRSAYLNYNLGNAHFKMNDIPRAILFYERAALLNPADENINYNLQIARTLIVDRFQEIPELFFVRWYNFVSLIMTSNSWATISLVTFILSLLFLSLYIYSSKYRLKVIGFWLAVSLFVFSSGGLAFSLRNKSLVYDSHKAIILTPAVSGKSSPDASGTDLFVLHEGTRVSIEDEIGEWCEVRLSDGNKGWILLNTLTII